MDRKSVRLDVPGLRAEDGHGSSSVDRVTDQRPALDVRLFPVDQPFLGVPVEAVCARHELAGDAALLCGSPAGSGDNKEPGRRVPRMV
jgi:hypothetical protein